MKDITQEKYTSSTRRIAKNTLMLYFRQILIMLVSLYTVRVVLNTLGAEDYGIYNVVAGVVVLFSFVNNAMATATQRFLNYNLGKNDNNKTQQTFSTSLIIHAGIAIIFVFIAETVGLWFVNLKLNIPEERHSAALWCYQFSIITTVFNILRVPYNAVIIAYEKMSFFAWMSIIEGSLKLLVAFLLIIFPFDKLIVYVILLTFISIVILFCYKIYCNKKFEIARYKKVSNTSLVKEILGFSGWSLFGATANVANQQGTNIVLNLFTNVTVNAAMGIANQVNSAVYSFVSNFQTAFNPQLVKSYASENFHDFQTLIIRSSKFSFYLVSLMVIPLYINCDFILRLWLQMIPEYSVSFVQLILLWSLIDSLNGPLWMSIQATGNIRKYQIIVSILIFVNLPLSAVALSMGFSPESILLIRIVLNMITTSWRIFFLKKRVRFVIKEFLFDVVCRCICIYFISFYLTKILSSSLQGFVGFVLSCLISGLINFTLIFIFGITKSEKVGIKQFLCRRFNR